MILKSTRLKNQFTYSCRRSLCSNCMVTGGVFCRLNFGQFISSLYCFGLFLGTIYSFPPLTLKRCAVLAYLIIATVLGFLLNFGVYHATRAALALPFDWSSPVAFITTFVTLFALVIAITKDLPYVEGDRKRNSTMPAHAVLAVCLVFQTWVLEQANYTKEAISEYYRFIWNLFYAQYIVFPFI